MPIEESNSLIRIRQPVVELYLSKIHEIELTCKSMLGDRRLDMLPGGASGPRLTCDDEPAVGVPISGMSWLVSGRDSPVAEVPLTLRS
jgi:hypothetical protein